MRKERYLTPSVQLVTGFETGSPILQGSNAKADVIVDPIKEYYYDGTEETEDHLYEL